MVKLKPQGFQAILILIVFVGLVPFFPDKAIDPWHLFNPRKFGMLLATIAGIQFASYIAIRLFGHRLGMAITGFLGGLISSTAVFANLGTVLHSHPTYKPYIISSAIFAILAMVLEVCIIVLVASPTLFLLIAKPLIVMAIVSALLGIFLLYFQKTKVASQTTLSNPLNVLSVLYTSIFIAATLITITVTKRIIGTQAVLIISFLGGLFELHGLSLATSLLYLNHQVTALTAIQILYVALFASFISKYALLFIFTPFRFAMQTALFISIVLISGIFTYLVFSYSMLTH